LRAQGDVTRAWTELTARAADNPRSVLLQLEMGWVALERRQFVDARQAFERALHLAPQSRDARSGLVATEIATGRIDVARKHVDAWRQALPNDRRLDVLAARVELSAGNSGEAERLLQAVLSADPSQLDAYELLGRMYLLQKRLDRAIEQYEKMAQQSARPTGPKTLVGMLHAARGEGAKAREVYEQIVAADPRAGIAANNLAWIYADEGRLDDALRLAQRADEQLRRRPEAADTLGWVYFRRRQSAEAIAAFNRAIERAPANAVYRYHLALAHLQMGDQQRGREELRRALKLDPDFAGADDARKKLSSSPGT
jgi:tetratricopeptide (TPR) repeat protein